MTELVSSLKTLSTEQMFFVLGLGVCVVAGLAIYTVLQAIKRKSNE